MAKPCLHDSLLDLKKIRKVFAQNLSNIEAAFMYLDFRYEIMLYLLLIGIKIKQFFRK